MLCTLLAGLLLTGCIEREDEPDSPAGVSSTQVATTVSSTPVATATPSNIALTPGVSGTPGTLAPNPQPRATSVPEQRSLEPFVASTLTQPDPRDTALYDVAANTALNLGPGTIGQFSPNSKLMVWSTLAGNNATEVWLIDVATKQRRILGLGRDPRFLDDGRVVAFTGGQTREIIDVATGARTPLPSGTLFPDFSVVPISGGTFRLRTMTTEPAANQAHRYAVEEVSSSRVIFEFSAALAAAAGTNEIVLTTPPVNGTTNIYVVSVPSGEANFVATARWQAGNWPLAASEKYIAWTEAFCANQDRGKTRLFDRATSSIRELNASFYVRLTPSDQLAVGDFGAKTLIDAVTLRTEFALPGTTQFDRGPEANWSPDYKFASTGFVGGHGGLCP